MSTPLYVQVNDLAVYQSIGDAVDDSDLETAINTAESDVDEFCGWGTDGFSAAAAVGSAKVFSRRTVSEDGMLFTIPRGIHSITGLVIETDDAGDGTWTTWATTDYELSPFDGYFAGVDGYPFFEIRAIDTQTFPTSTVKRGVVRITALWGWAAVPPSVLSAVRQRAAALHQRRRKSLDGTSPLTGFRAGGRDRDWLLELGNLRHPRKVAGFG